MPVWTHLFEDYYHDIFCRLDCRHPFFDLRLANFLLAVPMLQKRDKKLIRQAMRGFLPEKVLSRPKSVIMFDSLRVSFANQLPTEGLENFLGPLSDWIDTNLFKDSLQKYIQGGPGDRYTTAYPVNLALWLESKL